MKIFGIPLSFTWANGLGLGDPVVPFQYQGVKLGRPLQPVRDHRSLRFANYVKDLPPTPAVVDYGARVKNWLMLANDKLGDCTCAGILHAIMLWLSNNGFAAQFTDQDCINLYQNLCGYDSVNPDTDQGGVEIDILKAWRKSPIAGCELLAFAYVNPKNWEHVKLAHYLAGTLYMGVALPLSAQIPGLWKDLSDEPGGWGGHCMITSAYRDTKALMGLVSNRRLTAITWGTTQEMTPEWLAKYCDELWIPITSAWFGKEGTAPNGFDLAQLMADVAAVSQTPIN